MVMVRVTYRGAPEQIDHHYSMVGVFILEGQDNHIVCAELNFFYPKLYFGIKMRRQCYVPLKLLCPYRQFCPSLACSLHVIHLTCSNVSSKAVVVGVGWTSCISQSCLVSCAQSLDVIPTILVIISTTW